MSLGEDPSPQTFQRFFQGWLVRQEEVRQQLRQAHERQCSHPGEEDPTRLRQLIGRVLAHYAEYYRAKLRVARGNVLILFGPPWFTAFERSLLWIAGFKPALTFRLVSTYVRNMTLEQKRRMEQLRVETAEEEAQLTAHLVRIQTRPSAVSLAEVAARLRETVNGQRDRTTQRMEILKLAAGLLVECADILRCQTVLKIVGILTPPQAVTFFLALTQLQTRVREWGLQQEASNHAANRLS